MGVELFFLISIPPTPPNPNPPQKIWLTPTAIFNELSWIYSTKKNSEMSHLNHSNRNQDQADKDDERMDGCRKHTGQCCTQYVNKCGIFCNAIFIPNHLLTLGVKPPAPATFFLVSRDPRPDTCLMAKQVLTKIQSDFLVFSFRAFFLLMGLCNGYCGPLFIAAHLIELQERRLHIYISVILIQKAKSN